MILALTSETHDVARMYDAASSILQQKLSQSSGVGQVTVGGGALPAVRVDVNPTIVNALGLGLGDVRTALANANAQSPEGSIADERQSWSLATTDQLLKAKEYQAADHRPTATARRCGWPTWPRSPTRSRTSAPSVSRTASPAVLIIIFRQPGANIIETVDRVRALLPQLQAEIPAGIHMDVVLDRTTTIRASVRDVEFTLVLSIFLVVAVVFLFLRNLRSTLIPSVAVPVSLIGTFGVMYLLGYSVDNLSLMALTIATGFVVDDAIVVVENITRYLEQGMSRWRRR
jgi:multidrug efflux pump